MQRGGCVRKYYLDKGLNKYVGVMLKGKMEVLTDQETKDMIWHKCDTMFYIIFSFIDDDKSAVCRALL